MADELEVAENIILGEETGHLAGAEGKQYSINVNS